ncbi:(d)CMP kinase [Lascolabacillus sp.]|uniref:(d)CMP kinase n=1 Tax=Lascolabacillus sp. TaxID=1924068 RepID=UPI002588BC46|nr:(d)CMP kinase [Lascolabacillus sp.]MDD2606589.1 (d)CMP kinase [Lascolabacillus sp.]
MHKKRINIAVDGYSSCGKSTIAKGLAKKLGYTYIDSGAMYRAVALFAIRKGWITDQMMDEKAIIEHLSNIKITFKPNLSGVQETFLNDENVEKEIRTLEVANGASRVSTLAAVRKEMVRQQQEMGINKGVVMDGRDIGTVVFPNAEMKLFMTCSPEIRAKRRYDEMVSKGESPLYEDVLANVKERDLRDTTREESPLRQAEDAIVLDNSEIGIDEQLIWALNMFNKITGNNEQN